jgi:hypothetical protein
MKLTLWIFRTRKYRNFYFIYIEYIQWFMKRLDCKRDKKQKYIIIFIIYFRHWPDDNN